MKHLFLINPAAGKRGSTDALCRQITETFAGLGLDHEVFLGAAPGDCERRARAAAESGEPVRLYACGGDGTLNEVVNAAAGFDNAAVTNVPKGTGNDFIKLFGPTYRTAFSDLAALAAGPQAAFDLMDCNGRLGIDVCCAGVDARIAADVHRYKDWHFLSGKGAYIFSLIENILFKGISRPMKVEMGPVHYEGPVAIVCICNGRHYGGGFMPVADAMPDDGVLDMLLVPKVSLFTFVRLVGKYAQGRYKEYPQLIRDFHGQEITWSSDQPLTVVVDGEEMRDTRFTVRLSDKRINFFYPKGASYQPQGGAGT